MIKIDKDTIRETYLFFINRISKHQQVVKFSVLEEKSIENFLVFLKKKNLIGSIGANWLFDFFSFQFNYWEGKNYQQVGRSKILRITWIIGEKAYLRWENRKDNYKYFVRKYFLQKYKISFSEFRIFLGDAKEKEFDFFREEYIKKTYLNTLEGFLYCLDNTTLYTNKSKTCLKCLYNKRCLEILKKKFPITYYKRKIFKNG